MASKLFPALLAGVAVQIPAVVASQATPPGVLLRLQGRTEAPFTLRAPAEVVATITARCDECAWGVAGSEAVTVAISVDGNYLAHVPLVRRGKTEYRALIGPLTPGQHSVRLDVDPNLTARGLRRDGAAEIESIDITTVAQESSEYTAVSLAPFIHARPNAVERFTDVPVFMWYEREPTPRGVRYRYSVIFTNEDGGTPADRLMATWGRTTDIEYVYSVEVDQNGNVLADDYQGPEHKVLPFAGKRIGRHPLLWVSTDNNMVLDSGSTAVRYAPAPVAFQLRGVSREAVMDANPWMYEVAAQELARENKIVEGAPPGRGVIPDPRTFVYVEACGEVGTAAVAFEVIAPEARASSDRGVPEYRIVRDGCFRAAIPFPRSVPPSQAREVAVHAYARPARPGRAAVPPSVVRLDRVKLFTLDDRHRPRGPILEWSGPATIGVGRPLRLTVP